VPSFGSLSRPRSSTKGSFGLSREGGRRFELPVTTTEFTVELPRAKMWEILNDPSRLGKCVPGCEEVQVLGPEDSRWKVKLNVGIISRRMEARAKVVERVEPSRMVIKIESVEGDITGSWKLDLSELHPGATKVNFVADMTARGSFEWVVNQMIKTQLSKMVSQFVACISKTAT
jgi:uncharacterized protein